MQFKQDGGHLTRDSNFGTDPLSGYDYLQLLTLDVHTYLVPKCLKMYFMVIRGCLLMQFYSSAIYNKNVL